jgi:hypothetical protein
MSEPTLKDVLDASARLEKGQAEIRSEMATKSELAKVDAKVETVSAKVDAHRAETSKGFAALDEELGGHSERAHRALEERLDKLEARLPAPRPAPRTPRRR